MLKSLKILLFGGSFDPPHLGHQKLLRAGLRALKPDLVYLLPAHQSPLKAGHCAGPADRRRMAELLARSIPGATRLVRVDRFELRRRRVTYTYEALRHFRARHPRAELWFLAGSDAVASLRLWKRPEELRRSCRWLIGRRPGTPSAPKALRARLLAGVFPNISSTEIRGRLFAGQDVSTFVPPAIIAYAKRRRLYGAATREALRRTLPPERYRHTLGVAAVAVELAAKHGLDPEAAALAGLMHDAGRRYDLSAMVRYARRRRLRVPQLGEIERHAPILAHAHVSEDIARRYFKVSDPSVLSAVRHHTLGAAGMAPLDRLLYVADIASEDRGFPEAARIRRLARRDLDAALAEAVRVKISYVASSGQWLHPATAALWKWARDRA